MTQHLDQRSFYDFECPEPRLAVSLLNPYDLSIEVPGFATLNLGRFSLSLLNRIVLIVSREHNAQLHVGAFCEANRQSCIVVGGEHRNRHLFNYSFGGHSGYFYHFLSPDIRSQLLEQPKGISIGDNVVLSTNSCVLDGSIIGSGAVIAAGAIVKGACEELAIFGGVPARRLKARFSDDFQAIYKAIDLPNICAHELPRLPALIADLEVGRINICEFKSLLEYLEGRPKILLTGRVSEDSRVELIGIRGFEAGDRRIEEGRQHDILMQYFAQAIERPSKVRWSPDIFRWLGLC